MSGGGESMEGGLANRALARPKILPRPPWADCNGPVVIRRCCCRKVEFRTNANRIDQYQTRTCCRTNTTYCFDWFDSFGARLPCTGTGVRLANAGNNFLVVFIFQSLKIPSQRCGTTVAGGVDPRPTCPGTRSTHTRR